MLRGVAQYKRPHAWELVNALTVFATDAAVWWCCGWRGAAYLWLSLWFGYSFHPAAAHFIQEHYTKRDGQETYSYYGPLNAIFLNIGYHNEHHDFPRVPWSRLPLVHTIAAEFYTPFDAYFSWIAVFYTFIFDASFGPQSRVVRSFDRHADDRSSFDGNQHVPPPS